MIGPGKYDDMAQTVMHQTGAKGVLVIVVDGLEGSGFSVKATTPDFEERIPSVLRMVAGTIEDDRRVKRN